jgi:hypothetical protein
MSGSFDAVRIGIQLDRAEAAGLIETDVAEQLRALVRQEADSRARVRLRLPPFTGSPRQAPEDESPDSPY